MRYGMVATNRRRRRDRYKVGNAEARNVANYINFRDGTEFCPSILANDYKGEDFVNRLTGKIIQVKCREGMLANDVEVEWYKFIKIDPNLPFNELQFCKDDGRDKNCSADEYVVFPSHRKHIFFSLTRDVHIICQRAIVNLEHKSLCGGLVLGDGDILPIYSDDFIRAYWRQVLNCKMGEDSRSITLLSDEEGIQVKFMIDEGKDEISYAKFLIYIPESVFLNNNLWCRFLKIREGEDLSDRTTWLPR